VKNRGNKKKHHEFLSVLDTHSIAKLLNIKFTPAIFP